MGYRQRLEAAIERARGQIADPEALDRTLTRLVDDGHVPPARAAALRAELPAHLERSGYVLGHLGAHLGIAMVFAFDVIPLPLGTISRVLWVAGNRGVETLRGNRARARVHSIGVLAIAAIPLLGYAAYLLPLRRDSAELSFLLANHAWLARTGRTYEQLVAGARPGVRRLARWLVPAYGAADQVR